MIVLDTNVVSEISKPTPNGRAMAWLNRQPEQTLYLTAISVAELLEGLAILPEGRRKAKLSATIHEILAAFANPILPFDDKAAPVYARLYAEARTKRYTLPFADAQIAAIAAVHGYAVATRDVKPFLAAGVAVINPWEA